MINPLEAFDQYRPLLFGIAYRMLGTVMDAEDILQEAYLRWQRAPVDDVDSPKAYLAATVTRLSIDALRSAQSRREKYIGPWLPEPLITDPTKEPFAAVMMSESLSMAFLVILERLTPDERAAFLLHEVFDYGYAEIADFMDKSEAACRQLVSRAKKHVQDQRPRFNVNVDQQKKVLARFNEAIAAGDMQGLLSVLADDVTSWSDGGGTLSVAKKPVIGKKLVATFLIRVARLVPPGVRYAVAAINHQPGVIVYAFGRPYSVVVVEIDGEHITGFRTVVNPAKLRRLPPADQLPDIEAYLQDAH